MCWLPSRAGVHLGRLSFATAALQEFIHTQQHRFWMGWWNERMKEGAGAGEAGTAAAAEGATGAGSAGGASKNL